MNTADYLNKVTDFSRKAQQPIQSMIELNLQTLQNFRYIRPEELSSLKKPEDLLEKNVQIAIENGRTALDYMEKSFRIYEDVLTSFLGTAKTEVAENSNKNKNKH